MGARPAVESRGRRAGLGVVDGARTAVTGLGVGSGECHWKCSRCGCGLGSRGRAAGCGCGVGASLRSGAPFGRLAHASRLPQRDCPARSDSTSATALPRLWSFAAACCSRTGELARGSGVDWGRETNRFGRYAGDGSRRLLSDCSTDGRLKPRAAAESRILSSLGSSGRTKPCHGRRGSGLGSSIPPRGRRGTAGRESAWVRTKTRGERAAGQGDFG